MGNKSMERVGLPPLAPTAKDSSELRLPPLPVRRPFTLAEQRAALPRHPLAASLPRRRVSKGPGARSRPTDDLLHPQHFVHTSERVGLTCERAEHAIGLLRAQLARPIEA